MTIKLFLKEKGDFIIIGILLLFFFTDSLNVILSHGSFPIKDVLFTHFTRLSSISKGITLLLIFGSFFFFRKYLPLILTFLSVIALFALIGINFNNKVHVFTWIIRLFKITLPFILFFFIKYVLKINDSHVYNTFRLVIAIQVIVVILAFVFGWDLFLTYGRNRFGYSGLIVAQNEATFFYVIASVFLLRNWELFGRRVDLILIAFVLFASLILGTKAIFIFHLSLVLYFIVTQKYIDKLVLGIISALGTIIAFYVLYITGVFDFYIQLAHESGWLVMVTSLRSTLIEERLPAVFANWNWYNYLFGGVNPHASFVEMDFIDLFLYGGIIGTFIYLFILFKSLFAFSKKNYLAWFLVSQYVIIGGLAGHIFASGVNGIYLALTCYFLQKKEKKSMFEGANFISGNPKKLIRIE